MELTDIHCHILPGVDDGADTMEEARKMLRLEYEDGVRTIIATPHYREGMFEPAMRQVVKAPIPRSGRWPGEWECVSTWGANIIPTAGW